METDQHLGKSEARLGEPDHDLHDLDREECGNGGSHAARTSASSEHDRPDEEHDGARERRVGGPAVEVLQELGVEAVAGSGHLLGVVAGVGAGARGEDAEDDGDGHEQAREVDDAEVPTGHDLHGTTRAAVDPVDEHRREGDQHDRDDEVQPHHVGVQPGEDGDAAEDGLCGDGQPLEQGQAEEVRPLPTHADDREERGDHDDRQDEGQQTVAELDDAVDPHLRRVHERVVRAARPGGATEAGGGQPDGTAGGDEDELEGEREPGDDPDPFVDRRRQPLPEPRGAHPLGEAARRRRATGGLGVV